VQPFSLPRFSIVKKLEKDNSRYYIRCRERRPEPAKALAADPGEGTMPANKDGLRIVAYCVRPLAYQVVANWCASEGHRLLLVVTTPGPKSRPSPMFRELVDAAPRTQEVLITTRMQRPMPLIRELEPDLVVSFTFPYRIPPEVVAIPKYGAVNLHPSPLPLYRGPNPLRSVYDGYPTLGSTLHWTAPEYDTGNILAQRRCPLPDDRSLQSLLGAWAGTMRPALEEGVARALAGDPGTPQDESQASYGANYTAEERWLDWDLPATLLQGRAVVLAMNSEGLEDESAPGCLARIDGAPYAVRRVTPLRGLPPSAPPGAVLSAADGIVTLCCADGVLQVQAEPLEAVTIAPAI
jgi:methionyl-tRNA formyltransferase